MCSRKELIEEVWGPNWVGDTHVVDVHLSNLRRKLQLRAPELKFIHTVRGVGFRLSNELSQTTAPAATPAVPVESAAFQPAFEAQSAFEALASFEAPSAEQAPASVHFLAV